ncbi:glycerol-3-phosphate 1-O-acyltransferase PlsY [Pelagibacteraceae bacterium]|jgi:glycerol-3-phosphate acyltransferase PlsY|nr:glycerol-3-phosphate 1-O-acyltransferase PlsY [Pelagibacteraceae bacterium]
MDILIVLIYSYILGSIPFGLIITKIFLNKDIRKVGSGNIGTTNVLRTGKKSLAITTLLLDALKGYVSVLISLIYFNDLIFLSALICFIGHIFPIWLNFKGGKGVAVYLGIIAALSFPFAIVFSICWIVLALIFKYSSVSSIVGSLSVLLYSIVLNNYSLSFFLFIIFIIILFTHRDNIQRLKNSKETKIKL